MKTFSVRFRWTRSLTHVFERLQDLPLGVGPEEHGDLLQGDLWGGQTPRDKKLEHVYCFKERTVKWKLRLCPLTSTFHLWVIHNDPSAKASGLTCVVGRVVVGVQKLLDIQGAGEQGMLGNWVQIGLQPPLPLCDELPVHVSNELFGWKRESDTTHLQGRRGGESWCLFALLPLNVFFYQF